MVGTASPATTTLTRNARRTLAAFVLVFLASRIVVLLIMLRSIPDLFLWTGGTHVHHLNYGIALLVIVGGWGVFVRGSGPAPPWVAILYGIGLALTFDEFGMWLHLGGGYWQRASYDAVVTIAALLALIAVAPSVGRWKLRHWGVAVVVVLLLAWGVRLASSALTRLQPRLDRIESSGPQ